MPGRGQKGADEASMLYCVVPGELADELHAPLREFFRDEDRVTVIVERRTRDRRSAVDRREAAEAAADERRRIRAATGRRIADRRASAVAVVPVPLPAVAEPHADRLVFIERLEPSDQHVEDLDTARIVTRFQAGDREAFGELYMRYFDRVYTYLQIAFDDPHGAEDATQQVFMKSLEALPKYERRSQPFRAWLFTIVRNHALKQLQRQARVDVVDPVELGQREPPAAAEEATATDLAALGWVSDRELLMLIERLPLAQRQVLLLRFMMDLPTPQIAGILHRSVDDIRALQSRALRFLKERLTALGRSPRNRERTAMLRLRRPLPVLAARRLSLQR